MTDPPRSPPLRVTSRNPVRDAKTIGHDVAMSRSVREAKTTALQFRYRKLMADETAAETDEDRQIRLESLLIHITFACDAIGDDLATLTTMTEGGDRREALVREVTNDLMVLAELSAPGARAPATWGEALEQLRGNAEALIRSDERSAANLTELDMLLERIDHAERIAHEALRTYLGYISA